MSTPTMRQLVRWVPFVVAVVVITGLSSSVPQWLVAQSTPGTSSLPRVVDPVLRVRSNSSDANVHTVLWFVAALALVWAMWSHGRRRLPLAAVAIWAYTWLIEGLPERSSQ